MENSKCTYTAQFRRLAAAVLAAALVTVPVTSPVRASPDTPTFDRTQVVAGATGFRLRLAFADGLQPYVVNDAHGLRPEKSYAWAEGDTQYLQWDFPMPTDGEMVVQTTISVAGSFRPVIVDFNTSVNRTGGSIAMTTDMFASADVGFTGIHAQTAVGSVLGGGTVTLTPAPLSPSDKRIPDLVVPFVPSVQLADGALFTDGIVQTPGPDTDIVEVAVGNARGLWISGAEFVFEYMSDAQHSALNRVTGNTLIWQVDDHTLGYLDYFDSVDDAIEFATEWTINNRSTTSQQDGSSDVPSLVTTKNWREKCEISSSWLCDRLLTEQ